MSMENKLNRLYKQNATKLEPPSSLDLSMITGYRAQVRQSRSGKMKTKSVYKKAVFIVASVVVLCGFGIGSTYLVSNSTEKMSHNVYINSQFELSNESISQTVNEKNEVKAQLNQGEYAVIYKPENNKDYPLVTVANLEELTDWKQWSELTQLEQITANEQLLNNSFTFEAGLLDHPYHPIVPIDQGELITELKQQYEQRNAGEIVWKKVSVEDIDTPFEIFSTKYSSQDGKVLYVNATLYDNAVERVDSYLANDKSVNTRSINGQNVIYVPFVEALNESGKIQSLTWLEDVEHGTVMYSIETEHESISEEMLYDIATELIN